MIVPYTELPDEAGGSSRPLLDVTVADSAESSAPCLVDSGALNTLLPAWLARAAGISLRRAKTRDVAVAAGRTHAAFVTTSLSTLGYRWEAEVGFCDPWPYGWGLLGQSSLFRFFTVTFRAFDHELELVPIEE